MLMNVLKQLQRERQVGNAPSFSFGSGLPRYISNASAPTNTQPPITTQPYGGFRSTPLNNMEQFPTIRPNPGGQGGFPFPGGGIGNLQNNMAFVKSFGGGGLSNILRYLLSRQSSPSGASGTSNLFK